MKKVTFTVTIEFSGKVTDDRDIMEITNNIAQAIADRENGASATNTITPRGADFLTERVTVQPQFLDNEVSIQINK
jgi:hypothetical protein